MQFWQAGQTFLAQLPELIRKNPQKMQKLFKIFFLKMFLWRSRKQFESPAEFFSAASRTFSARYSKKTTICNLGKKLSPESFHWNWESIFDNSATFFSRIGQKYCSVSKNERNSEIKLFFVEMLRWTRRMQFQHPHGKTWQEAENFLLTVSKLMKTFIYFPKLFFLQNDFTDTKIAVLTGRPNFSCSITGNDPKKSPQKMQKLFKIFPPNCSYGEVESSLKAPLTFFGQPQESVLLDIQKNNIL